MVREKWQIGNTIINPTSPQNIVRTDEGKTMRSTYRQGSAIGSKPKLTSCGQGASLSPTVAY